MHPRLRSDEQEATPLADARLRWLDGLGGSGERARTAPALVRRLLRLGRRRGAEAGAGAGAGEVVLLDADQRCAAATIRRCVAAGVPVIAISGTGSAASLAAALAAGAEEALSARDDLALSVQRVQAVLRRLDRDAAQQSLLARLTAYLPAPAMRPMEGPERLSAALLFSDLRGFTAASLSQDAAEVFETINPIIAAQIACIQAEEGYVDGFSGDGLLALFEGPGGADRACRAAAEILRWAEATAIGPWSKMPVAMGLHHGEVMRGDLGGEARRVFTALGSPINVAARLCGVASAREVVVSQELIASLSHNNNSGSSEGGEGWVGFTAPRQVSLKGIPAPLWVQTLTVQPTLLGGEGG